MIVLALDTCLGACSAAVVKDGAILAQMCEAMTRGHQERLGPMVQAVLNEARTKPAALDRIGVTVGPGSFTGLRVGLAFAKGLALALDRPCIGIGTLEALAASFPSHGRTAAVIDSGRGNLYLQLFDAGRALTAPDVVDMATAVARILKIHGDEPVSLIGPGTALLADVLPNAKPADLAAPFPAAIARLADKSPLIPPRPLYLRPPDAKPKAS